MKTIGFKIITLAMAVLTALTAFVGCSAQAPNADGFWGNGMAEVPEANYPSEKGEIAEGEVPDKITDDEDYAEIIENKFINVLDQPLSTFSADVDTAAYSNLRRMINSGYSIADIPPNAVRTEEMLNYFKYDYNLPKDNEPFGVTATIAVCPWNPQNMLAIFGFKTEEIDYSQNDKPSNLVFLVDVSGSMNSSDKLPLLKEAFVGLVENLNEKDVISIVTYSGSEKIVLKGCKGNEKDKILTAINDLSANGSTNGQSGLEKAYSLAADYFIEGGNNRIIMASDGDLNVGISSPEELKKFVAEKRESGIYLSVLGFGTGNYKDDNMEALADNGNGNYFYIDSVEEGKKVLGTDLNATINTIANDVKFQIDFNHEYIDSYRLIGYENRILNAEDFADDTKDAGEVGSGHCLTVAYELVMNKSGEVEKNSNEWLTVCVRYIKPGETQSNLLEYPISEESYTEKPNDDWYFAASVIELAMVIRESKYLGNADIYDVLTILSDIDLSDAHKVEFKTLVEKLISQSDIEANKDIGSRYQ